MQNRFLVDQPVIALCGSEAVSTRVYAIKRGTGGTPVYELDGVKNVGLGDFEESELYPSEDSFRSLVPIRSLLFLAKEPASDTPVPLSTEAPIAEALPAN